LIVPETLATSLPKRPNFVITEAPHNAVIPEAGLIGNPAFN
jgi:hypothetical protein